MREFDLRVPVAKWLLSRGLFPICEVQSLRNCDFIGVAFSAPPRPKLNRMVAVELKLADLAGVLYQCKCHLGLANEVWAAMPPVNEKAVKRFREAGIGLLEVEGGEVAIVVPSPSRDELPLDRWHRVARARRDEHQWRMLHPQMLRLPAEAMAREAAAIAGREVASA